MIGRVSGKVVMIKPPQVVVDVNGVGYELDLPIPDCANLSGLNESVILYTHLVIREDAHSLYGFLNLENRDCFRTLIKVSGIGPRIALALLSTLTPAELEVALENTEITTLCRTPGIGKKMAERMILELKGKLHISPSSNPNQPALLDSVASIRADVANALASLGYNDKEITKIMHQLPIDIENVSLGIKQALRLLNT